MNGHSLSLFTQVSEAAMATVPELNCEMAAFQRSVGSLRGSCVQGSNFRNEGLFTLRGQIVPQIGDNPSMAVRIQVNLE